MLPFMRARVQNIVMDLGTLEKSGATYMEFNAGGVACDDLRLAYSKIMTEYEVYKEDDFPEHENVSSWPLLQDQRSTVSLVRNSHFRDREV